MIRAALLAGACLALAACDTTQGLGEGDANYDAIKGATEACRAHGGELQLKSGYDGRSLSDYACKPAKAN